MRKIFYIFISFIILHISVFAASNAKSSTIKDGLLGGVQSNGTVVSNVSGKDGITSLFTYGKDTIFGVISLIVIGVFLFLGYKILISRGKPEEFKKAFLMLIYTIIGLLIISLSWVMVIFITGLKI